MRRHFGWKKAIGLGLGGALALLKNEYLPPSTDGVPVEALVLVERLRWLAVISYGFCVIPPLVVLFRKRRSRGITQRIRAAMLLVATLACVEAGFRLATLDRGFLDARFYLGWSATTLITPWLPVAALETKEWLQSRSWYRRWFLAGEGATAGMASATELRHRRFNPRFQDGCIGFNDGLPLGRTLFESTFAPFYARLRDELGTILLGSSRSGKSVRFLLIWLATNDGIKVLVDPKAHGLRLLAGRLSDPSVEGGVQTADISRAKERLENGAVFAFDAYELGSPYLSGAINPVMLIDPESDYCRVMLSAISQSVVIPSGDESHWVVELTRLFIEGLLMHVRTSRPLEQQSLGYLADLFAGLERAGDNVQVAGDYNQITRLVEEMEVNPAGGGICVSAAQAFSNLEGREVGILVSEMARSLKSFTDPVIRRATSGPGIDLRAFVESSNPATLFLSMPFGSLVEHSRVLRVIISCLLRLVEQRQNKSRPVHFFLDEFAAYAKNLTAVRDATVTLGGAGARLHIALQYIRQLEQCLGRQAADAFEASSNLVAAGVSDEQTLNYLSRRFGKHTITRPPSWFSQNRGLDASEVPVLDPATLARLLDRSSRIGACIPGSGSPFLFETLAHVPLDLQGTPMGVWPLPDDAFDSHLLAMERGEAAADPVAPGPQPEADPTPASEPRPVLRLAAPSPPPTRDRPTLRLTHRH